MIRAAGRLRDRRRRRWPTQFRLTAVLAASVLWADRAPAQPADWPQGAAAVLDRFLGTWETETWISGEGVGRRQVHLNGRAECRRALAGRYVEFRSHSVPAAYAELQIMTYDPARSRFLQWVFDSDGYRHSGEGESDEAQQRLRWRGTSGEDGFVIDDI
jgi:hypothetical protein